VAHDDQTETTKASCQEALEPRSLCSSEQTHEVSACRSEKISQVKFVPFTSLGVVTTSVSDIVPGNTASAVSDRARDEESEKNAQTKGVLINRTGDVQLPTEIWHNVRWVALAVHE
jgi:hypothetical protein